MISADNHPFSSDPLKSFCTSAAFVPVLLNPPIASVNSISPICMFLLPIPTLCKDLQSISRIVPADNACDNWYAAAAACCAFVPDVAASLEKPLIILVASPTSIPAFVNNPMFFVISPKL